VKALLLAGIALAVSGSAFAGYVPSNYVSTNGLDNLGGGSGVVIGPHEVLTANHVVNDCVAINVADRDAYVIAHDEGNDLAVIHTKDTWATWASFSNYPVRAGDQAVAMGYPLTGILADTANVSPGSVSALAGIKNDSRYFQITAPIQPGSSGDALYDVNGGIVGVVTSKLSLDVIEVTHDVPQNVNFAIKSEIARSFLDSNHVTYGTISYKQQLSPADIGEKTRPFTVRVTCYGHEHKEAKHETPSTPPGPSRPDGPTGPNNMTVYHVIQNLMLRSEPNKNSWNVLSAYAPYDFIPHGITFTFGPNPKCMYGNGQEVWCHVWYTPPGQPQTIKMWGWISAHFLRDNNGALSPAGSTRLILNAVTE
jgi:hypothetical protein